MQIDRLEPGVEYVCEFTTRTMITVEGVLPVKGKNQPLKGRGDYTSSGTVTDYDPHSRTLRVQDHHSDRNFRIGFGDVHRVSKAVG